MRADQDMGITELAQSTGVSVRTVRFYVSLGLLDRPDGRGRAATYAAENLDRLRLIRSLVDKRVHLREIQETVGRMEPAEVRQLLAREQLRTSHEAEARSHSPREYVSALLERARSLPATNLSAPEPTPVLGAPSATVGSPPPPYATRMSSTQRPSRSRRIAQAPAPAPPAAPPDGAPWRRITLAPGLELHVSLSMEETYRALIQRILANHEPRRRSTHGNE